MELFNRVLYAYLVPMRDIELFTAEIRAEGYGLLRGRSLPGEPSCDFGRACSGFDVSALVVEPGCWLDGKTLAEARLRKDHGLTILAVSRDGMTFPNPEAGFQLQGGDVAYLFGERTLFQARHELFGAPAGEPPAPSRPSVTPGPA